MAVKAGASKRGPDPQITQISQIKDEEAPELRGGAVSQVGQVEVAAATVTCRHSAGLGLLFSPVRLRQVAPALLVVSHDVVAPIRIAALRVPPDGLIVVAWGRGCQSWGIKKRARSTDYADFAD